MKNLTLFIISLLLLSTFAVFSFDNRTAAPKTWEDSDVNLAPLLETFTTVME